MGDLNISFSVSIMKKNHLKNGRGLDISFVLKNELWEKTNCDEFVRWLWDSMNYKEIKNFMIAFLKSKERQIHCSFRRYCQYYLIFANIHLKINGIDQNL